MSYTAGHLEEGDLAATPLEQFERWYADAAAAGIPEPNAMVLATSGPVVAGVADGDGPAVRTVLLKQADSRGFVFYTNYSSRKARQIEDGDGRVALLFPWHALQRQIAVLGRAERVPAEESRVYFCSRPWESRIGAWASTQSAPLPHRDDLDRRYAEYAARWPDHGSPDDVPMPEHWGGYLVRAHEIEFWQGRVSRLHDRLAYLAANPGVPADLADAPAWHITRRYP